MNKFSLKIISLYFTLIFWSCSGSDTTPINPGEDITVTFISPSKLSGLSYNKSYDFEVSVSKDVKSVGFYFDGQAIGTVAARPYKLAWTASDLNPGSHQMMAIAVAASGKEFKKEIEISFKLATGDDFRGGKIFDLDVSGNHGLIAAKADLKRVNGEETDFVWGASEATGTSFEDGPENTRKLAVQATQAGQMAHRFKGTGLDMYGFKDWYIPSFNELQTLRKNAALVGGFAENDKDAAYWSSTERNEQQAFYLSFGSVKEIYDLKSTKAKVRPIRKF